MIGPLKNPHSANIQRWSISSSVGCVLLEAGYPIQLSISMEVGSVLPFLVSQTHKVGHEYPCLLLDLG